MCKHLQYHVSHCQQLRLSTDLLGDLLTSIEQLQVSQSVSRPRLPVNSPSVNFPSVSPPSVPSDPRRSCLSRQLLPVTVSWLVLDLSPSHFYILVSLNVSPRSVSLAVLSLSHTG